MAICNAGCKKKCTEVRTDKITCMDVCSPTGQEGMVNPPERTFLALDKA